MANKKAEGKYDKFFLTDVIHGTMKPEWGGEVISAGAGAADIVPPNAKALPAITVIRKPYMFHDPVHKHIFTEFFFFFGSNPNDMNDMDADVEFSFGPNKEKHTMSKPTIVVAAPGVYHCPLNYARATKPFYCLECFMTTGYSGINLGEDAKEIMVPEPSYDRYFIDNVIKPTKAGGEKITLSAVPENIFPANAKISMEISVARKPHVYEEQTHKHSFTQIYYFFGSNPMNMKEFGGEVKFTMGAEKEEHIITGPTVVVVQPGTYHNPIEFTKVTKPIYYLEQSITSKYGFEPYFNPMAPPSGDKKKKK